MEAKTKAKDEAVEKMPSPHHLRRQQLLALKKQTCLMSTSSDNIFSFLHVQQQLGNYLRPVLSFNLPIDL